MIFAGFFFRVVCPSAHAFSNSRDAVNCLIRSTCFLTDMSYRGIINVLRGPNFDENDKLRFRREIQKRRTAPFAPAFQFRR